MYTTNVRKLLSTVVFFSLIVLHRTSLTRIGSGTRNLYSRRKIAYSAVPSMDLIPVANSTRMKWSSSAQKLMVYWEVMLTLSCVSKNARVSVLS